jgi:undecaprenyl-diphosphatase
MTGLILVNPGSGSSETSCEELAKRFPGHRVEESEPDDLAKRVAAAVAERVEFVGVAGGDGTVRTVAEQLAETGVPLLPIPAGTRNHFARDVGIATLDDAGAAVAAGRVIEVDAGRVNDRWFVNNSSIGLYPKIVIRREVREHRLPKGVANVIAMWEQLRFGHKLGVEVDGVRHRAWLVFVGNGAYGEGLLDLADRESLDANVLDLRVVRADRPWARLRVLGAVLLGRLARSPLVFAKHCRTCTIDVAQPRVEVALDGEVETLEAPLTYRSVAGALRVLVPPGPPGPPSE